MGKDKRHITIHKMVRRNQLLEEGKAHLPSNKVHTPLNEYKRKKFKKSDLFNLDI